MAMDVFERLNRKFGAWYEGLFGGGSENGELRPRDILRRILAAMEDGRREGLDALIYVPNVYTLQVAVTSDDERQYLRTFLDADELAAAVARSADQHGYKMRGALVFAVEELPASSVSAGERVRIQCRFDAQAALLPAPSAKAPAAVEMPYVAASLAEAAEDNDDDPGTVAAVPAATLASLVVRSADGRLQDVYPLTARGARIGRGRHVGNDIVLPGDALVSKSHARIVYGGGEFRLHDENSTNGTFVNAQRLTAGTATGLKAADQIRMGETVLLFRPAVLTPQLNPIPQLPIPEAALNSQPSLSQAKEGLGVRVCGSGYRLVAGDGEIFPLASEMTVGRSLTGDIVLIGNGVGSQHANLSSRGDSVYVEDLGTPGGTTVNGERIPIHFPVALYEGDQIGFGEVLLRLKQTRGGS